MIEQCPDSSKLTFLRIVDREFLSAAYTEAAPSLPRFTAIQGIQGKKDLPGLAPKGCFISAEAVDRVVGHIGEPQKAKREFAGRMHSRFDRSPGPYVLPCDVGSGSKLAESARPNRAQTTSREFGGTWRGWLSPPRWSAWLSNKPVSIAVARRRRHRRLANRSTSSRSTADWAS